MKKILTYKVPVILWSLVYLSGKMSLIDKEMTTFWIVTTILSGASSICSLIYLITERLNK